MKPQILSKPINLAHPSVKRVLEIAEEILNDNKILNVERLYSEAKRRLKIPRRGLLSIIQFLLSKKVLVEGSKFSKESVLSNKLRYNIFRYIKRSGGAHFSMIRKNVVSGEISESGSSGQLIWHLEMLLKFEHIKKIKVGNYSIFIPIDMNEEIGVLNFLIRDRINRKILRLILDSESIKKSQIYKEINEKRENVYYHINNLIMYNIIIEKEELENVLQINISRKEDLIKLLENVKEN